MSSFDLGRSCHVSIDAPWRGKHTDNHDMSLSQCDRNLLAKKLLTLDDIIMTLPGVSDNKLNHDNQDQSQFS